MTRLPPLPWTRRRCVGWWELMSWASLPRRLEREPSYSARDDLAWSARGGRVMNCLVWLFAGEIDVLARRETR